MPICRFSWCFSSFSAAVGWLMWEALVCSSAAVGSGWVVVGVGGGFPKGQRLCTRLTVPMNQLSDMYAKAERCACGPAEGEMRPRARIHCWGRFVCGCGESSTRGILSVRYCANDL